MHFMHQGTHTVTSNLVWRPVQNFEKLSFSTLVGEKSLCIFVEYIRFLSQSQSSVEKNTIN